MVDQRRLHLGGGDAVARHVHDVVDAPEEPEVSVVVDLRPVASEIASFETRPVGLLVTLGVAVQATEHGGPGSWKCQVPTAPIDRLPGIVDDFGTDPR